MLVSEVEPKHVISPAACQVVPRGQPIALDHDHVGPPGVSEVIGDRATDDTAADDDDTGALWEIDHRVKISLAPPQSRYRRGPVQSGGTTEPRQQAHLSGRAGGRIKGRLADAL